MITSMMNDRVTIVRLSDGPTNEYGRPSRVAQRFDSRARIEQRASREGEAYTIDIWRLALPPRTPIDAGDEVEYQGRRFSVVNAPDNLSIPGFSALDRVEVDLKFVGRLDAS